MIKDITMKKILIPPVFVFLSLILIVVFYILFPHLNIILFPYNLLGIVFIFLGIHTSGQSRDLFKKYKTTSDFNKPSCFIDEGIYKKTRNPMYLGMFCLLLGIAIFFQNLLSLIVPFFFVWVINALFIPFEEKMMLDTFGDQYKEYKMHVRKWI